MTVVVKKNWKTHEKQQHKPNTTDMACNEKLKGRVEATAVPPQDQSSPFLPTKLLNDNALLFKTVIVNALFHLLGILFGFILFYMTFRTECAQHIAKVMNGTNVTMMVLELQQRDEQLAMLREQNRQLKEHEQEQLSMQTNYEEKVTEMKLQQTSLLDEQSSLLNKHRECIQSKTILYEQLQSYQQMELNEKLNIHNLTSEGKLLRNTILQQEQTIEMIKSDCEDQFSKLSNQLNLTKAMLHEKLEEVERLQNAMGNDTFTVTTGRPHNNNKITKEMTQVQADIKRQQFATMMNTYGKPPLMTYHVTMIVQNINFSSNQNGVGPVVTLEIELNALYDMPHTTMTFLSMIENRLFHDTSLSPKQQPSKNTKKQPTIGNILLTGGHPNTCLQTTHQSKLKRSYAELGYNIQHLLYFTERNTKYKCSASMNTIGFAEYGPDLEIFYQSNDENSHRSTSQHTCFGQVVSGIDSLLLQQQQRDGSVDMKMRLRIIDTRIVKKDHVIQSNGLDDL